MHVQFSNTIIVVSGENKVEISDNFSQSQMKKMENLAKQ